MSSLTCLSISEERSHGPPVTPLRQLAEFVIDRSGKKKESKRIGEEYPTQVDARDTRASLAQFDGPRRVLSLYICLRSHMHSPRRRREEEEEGE